MAKIDDIKVVLKYAIKIANKNNFDGIYSFDNFKNKRASGFYLNHKIKNLKRGSLHFDNIYDLSNEAKKEVLNNKYGPKTKELITYVQEAIL